MMKVEHESHLLRLIQGFGDSQFTIGQCNMINGHAPAFDEIRKTAQVMINGHASTFDEIRKTAQANADHTIDQIHEILREDRD